MPLFGSPNVDKLRKKGHIGKLVGLLTHKDAHIASSALTALQQIANDKELERYRKQSWALYSYADVIKKIRKLNKEQRASIEQLFQNLITEKNELEKKKRGPAKRDRDELKKRFEDSFKSLSMADDNFFNKLWNILGENKEFVHTKKLPGRLLMSSFSGVIVTKDEIIYFELNLAPKVVAIRFNEINEFKFGMLKTSIKIKDQKGTWMQFPIGDGDWKMLAFIEDNMS